MENSILIALSRQVSIKDQIDMVANNLANMKTSGFKSSKVIFKEYLMPQAKFNGISSPQQSKLSYVAKSKIIIDFSQGNLTNTGNPFDVALKGDGFFVVETNGGERYTRSGSFKRAEDGTLTDLNNNPIMGDAGKITIASNDTQIMISKDGTITSNNGIKGRLRVVKFEHSEDLSGIGNSLYKSRTEPQKVEFPEIAQGMLEGSNVNSVEQMVDMIEVLRGYSRVNHLIENNHGLKQKSINKLAQVNY